MYAQISLVGRVTQDVELRARAATGEPYMQVNLAVNEGYGERTHTSFYQCWLDGDEAVRASKAGVKKGSLLFLAGQLSVVDVIRKDGTAKTVAKVGRAHWDYIPLGKKAADPATAAAPAAPQPAPTVPGLDGCAVVDLDEGDLPF